MFNVSSVEPDAFDVSISLNDDGSLFIAINSTGTIPSQSIDDLSKLGESLAVVIKLARSGSRYFRSAPPSNYI